MCQVHISSWRFDVTGQRNWLFGELILIFGEVGARGISKMEMRTSKILDCLLIEPRWSVLTYAQSPVDGRKRTFLSQSPD